MVTVGIFILCESFWVRAVKIPIITNTSWVISNSDNMSRVHFASELQHYYCILEIKLIFGENNPRIFASNRIWNTFTKANISTKNTSAKVFFDFEITLSSLVFSKQFCYLCQKRAAKISGKVTEKIRRIWVQNFSVELANDVCLYPRIPRERRSKAKRLRQSRRQTMLFVCSTEDSKGKALSEAYCCLRSSQSRHQTMPLVTSPSRRSKRRAKRSQSRLSFFCSRFPNERAKNKGVPWGAPLCDVYAMRLKVNHFNLFAKAKWGRRSG